MDLRGNWVRSPYGLGCTYRYKTNVIMNHPIVCHVLLVIEEEDPVGWDGLRREYQGSIARGITDLPSRQKGWRWSPRTWIRRSAADGRQERTSCRHGAIEKFT
jgi:hypothetical protein